LNEQTSPRTAVLGVCSLVCAMDTKLLFATGRLSYPDNYVDNGGLKHGASAIRHSYTAFVVQPCQYHSEHKSLSYVGRITGRRHLLLAADLEGFVQRAGDRAYGELYDCADCGHREPSNRNG